MAEKNRAHRKMKETRSKITLEDHPIDQIVLGSHIIAETRHRLSSTATDRSNRWIAPRYTMEWVDYNAYAS